MKLCSVIYKRFLYICSMGKRKTTAQFIEDAIRVHGNIYDYSKVNYLSSHKNIIVVCKEHGNFEQSPSNHLSGKGCMKCGGKKKFTTGEFVQKANKVHRDKFSYLKTKYKNKNTKVIITCLKHGDFEQEANAHLQGNGCPKCGWESTASHVKQSSPGWTHTRWQKAGQRSKNFDSFKVYILRCWNEEEEFYKIGKTFLTIKERFRYKKEMPYNYEIIKIFKGEAKEMSKLEKQLQKENKNNKYVPETNFGGMYECFNNILINE